MYIGQFWLRNAAYQFLGSRRVRDLSSSLVQAELLVGFGVLTVVGGVAPKEDETWLHNSGVNHALVRRARVSEVRASFSGVVSSSGRVVETRSALLTVALTVAFLTGGTP